MGNLNQHRPQIRHPVLGGLSVASGTMMARFEVKQAAELGAWQQSYLALGEVLNGLVLLLPRQFEVTGDRACGGLACRVWLDLFPGTLGQLAARHQIQQLPFSAPLWTVCQKVCLKQQPASRDQTQRAWISSRTRNEKGEIRVICQFTLPGLKAGYFNAAAHKKRLFQREATMLEVMLLANYENCLTELQLHAEKLLQWKQRLQSTQYPERTKRTVLSLLQSNPQQRPSPAEALRMLQ